MKRLDVERPRKFPGLESLTDEQAQKVIADLHSLSVMLVQSVLNDRAKFKDDESEIIEPKDSDNQEFKSK